MINPQPRKMNNLEQQKSFFKRFWWILVIIVIGVFILILTIVSGADNDQNGGNSGKGVFGLGNNEKEFNERIVKTFLPESGAAFKYNSPMLHGDYLYLGTSSKTGYDNPPFNYIPDNFFYKMDLDLNVVWKYPLQKRMVTGGAVMDTNGNVYFIAELVTKNPDFDKNQEKQDKDKEYYSAVSLVSLDSAGQWRWEKPVSEEHAYWNRGMTAPAISADNIIYLGHERFFAFDTSGNMLGQYPDSGKKIKSYGGAPVIDGTGHVYFTASKLVPESQDFATENFQAYKFSPRLASLVWSTEMGNEVMSEIDPSYTPRRGLGIESTPALGLNDKSLYGITGCTISKIDTATGELLWAVKPDGVIGYINASPAVDGQDNVYVGSKSNQYSKFFAIKSDGTLLWRKDIGADLYNSPILGDDNKIYVGSETVPLPSGKFHVLDRLTGEEIWSLGTDNERVSPDFSFDSMLLHRGYVYVGSHTAMDDNDLTIRNQVLFKIKVDATEYLPGAAWPRIHGGNSNSGRLEI